MGNSENIGEKIETLSSYRDAVDSNDAKKNENFRGKPLNLYIQFVSELSTYIKAGKDIKPYLNDMVTTLTGARRYLDLAAIYNYLKNQNRHNTQTGEVYPLIKDVMSRYANDLFIKSLTYSSKELNEMFSDVFGNDQKLLMELIGHIFREYGLFNARLSENIYRKIVDTAQSDIRGFIEHSDTRFLSFYISNLSRMPFISPEHIADWTNLILSQSTKDEHTAKILSALKEHPALDFLLIFLLSPRDHDRSEALSLLVSCLEMGIIDEKHFRNEAVYFLEKMVSSQFYDFHSVSRTQKELTVNLMATAGGDRLARRVVSVLKEKNAHGDPKIKDTKVMFVYLLSRMAQKDPQLEKSMKLMLQDSQIEENVKEAIIKTISSNTGKN